MLHDFLSHNRDEIISRCERRYRQRHPEKPTDELLNTIPTFIDELIKAERRVGGILEHSKLPEDTEEARAHGEQRFRSGFRIEELAQDFGTICDVIGELAVENQVELDPRSYLMLNQCIDVGIAQSISKYFELSREQGMLEVAEWVGVLGHELRNALATAMMAYAVVKTGQVGVDSKTARVLERSLSRLEDLVDETLLAVQLKSGRPLQRQTMVVERLFDDIEASACRERDISIAVVVEHALTIVADRRLLETALSNLVQNAIKFTRSGGRVELRASSAGPIVLIEVQDECGGLSDQAPEDLFKPFVQGGGTTRGMGLGLSITRQAVEAHGGTLFVRNLPGQGCIFAISIPGPDHDSDHDPHLPALDSPAVLPSALRP